MCIRDSPEPVRRVPGLRAQEQRLLPGHRRRPAARAAHRRCLLYTSDAADERSSVDLGGRRIIKKKKDTTQSKECDVSQNKVEFHRTARVSRSVR